MEWLRNVKFTLSWSKSNVIARPLKDKTKYFIVLLTSFPEDV